MLVIYLLASELDTDATYLSQEGLVAFESVPSSSTPRLCRSQLEQSIAIPYLILIHTIYRLLANIRCPITGSRKF